MSAGKQNAPSIDGIRAFYRSDSSAKAILDYCAGRKNNSSETKVDRLVADVGHREGEGTVSRSEVISTLRELEKLGCGTFVIGRRGQPSRFQWDVQMIALGKAAKGDELPILSQSESHEEDDIDIDDPDQEIRLIPHSYRLRRNLNLTLHLPDDLTGKEAARLGEFIKTLPFEESEHFSTQKEHSP